MWWHGWKIVSVHCSHCNAVCKQLFSLFRREKKVSLFFHDISNIIDPKLLKRPILALSLSFFWGGGPPPKIKQNVTNFQSYLALAAWTLDVQNATPSATTGSCFSIFVKKILWKQSIKGYGGYPILQIPFKNFLLKLSNSFFVDRKTKMCTRGKVVRLVFQEFVTNHKTYFKYQNIKIYVKDINYANQNNKYRRQIKYQLLQ